MDALTWVSMVPPSGIPKSTAQSGMESVAFNLNKILMKAKTDENKAVSKAFAVMGKKQVDLIKAHFQQGLNWSGTKSVTEAGGAPAPAAKPAATEEKAVAAEPKKAAPKK